MGKRQLVTLHAVTISDPNNPGSSVTGYDQHGDPVYRKHSLTIPPAVLHEFDLDEVDFADLFKVGAIREPTETELALGYAVPEDRPVFASHNDPALDKEGKGPPRSPRRNGQRGEGATSIFHPAGSRD